MAEQTSIPRKTQDKAPRIRALLKEGLPLARIAEQVSGQVTYCALKYIREIRADMRRRARLGIPDPHSARGRLRHESEQDLADYRAFAAGVNARIAKAAKKRCCAQCHARLKHGWTKRFCAFCLGRKVKFEAVESIAAADHRMEGHRVPPRFEEE